MNITTALPIIPASPMPASDFVGRDNQQRSMIQESSAAAENGTATDKQTADKHPPNKPHNAKPDSAKADSAKPEDKKPRSETQDSRRPEDKKEADRTPAEQREVQQQIQKLKSRDAEVRAHEQAHAAIGGQHAGSPNYEYERGSDGKSYAVGGEVPIDISAVPGDPQATIQKMTVVRRAALAPAQPSSADRSIAAEASTKAAQARAELAQQNNNVTGKEEDATATETIQGPVTKTLEEADKADKADSEGRGENATAPTTGPERKTLSAPERSAMIADFYQQKISPSATGFTASA
ncbi:MAG: putative metalloprotease CJM1_0395 family protein [Pseudomonadota bacterium]